MTTPSYDTDFYAWTQAQAAALRAKDWPALDLENLAEEIESVGQRDRDSIESQLVRLLLHLLKLTYDPATRPRRGWRVTVADARERVARRPLAAYSTIRPPTCRRRTGMPAVRPRWQPSEHMAPFPGPARGRSRRCWMRSSGRRDKWWLPILSGPWNLDEKGAISHLLAVSVSWRITRSVGSLVGRREECSAGKSGPSTILSEGARSAPSIGLTPCASGCSTGHYP